MRHFIHFLMFLIVLSSCKTASEDMSDTSSESRLERRSFQSTATDLERDFYVYVPKGYDDDPEKEWPMMLFLHGNGERGNGKDELDWVLVHGPVYEAWIQKRDLPFIIVSPQMPMWSMGEVPYIKNRNSDAIPDRLEESVPPRNPKFPSDQPMTGDPMDIVMPQGPEGLVDGYYRMEDDLLAIMDIVKQNYSTDNSRIYLTGLSYGGFGTWYMASKHPELFAAIAPIVGYGHPDLMDPIAEHKIPVWAFAGGRDPVVQVKYFYPGMNRLEELGHKVRFTTEEDMSHDVWTRVFAGQDLYTWFLQHSID